MLRFELPPAAPGQSIGLLGGSFDPAHAGHVHITLEALRRFRLDRVWWLVSPGNPLKRHGPASLERRMARAREVMRHPRVAVTDVEARLGTRYTAQTLARLRRLRPRVRFVWLMGADNLVQLHLWEDWRSIVEGVPMGVLARPGMRLAARHSVAARAYAHARLTRAQAASLARRRPPAWALVNVPMLEVSSSRIRAEGGWPPSPA
jgi:nicotinate-nucleotide adenylyltransferase